MISGALRVFCIIFRDVIIYYANTDALSRKIPFFPFENLALFKRTLRSVRLPSISGLEAISANRFYFVIINEFLNVWGRDPNSVRFTLN